MLWDVWTLRFARFLILSASIIEVANRGQRVSSSGSDWGPIMEMWTGGRRKPGTFLVHCWGALEQGIKLQHAETACQEHLIHPFHVHLSFTHLCIKTTCKSNNFSSVQLIKHSFSSSSCRKIRWGSHIPEKWTGRSIGSSLKLKPLLLMYNVDTCWCINVFKQPRTAFQTDQPTSRHFQMSAPPPVKLMVDTRHGASCQAKRKGLSRRALRSWKRLIFSLPQKRKKKNSLTGCQMLVKILLRKTQPHLSGIEGNLLWTSVGCGSSAGILCFLNKMFCIGAVKLTRPPTIPDGVLMGTRRQLGL